MRSAVYRFLMTDETDRPSQRALAGGSSPSNADGTGATPAGERLGRVLRNRRRRYVLHCLTTSETPMALADLADDLVRWETDSSPPTAQDVRERVYVSLYHCHLPKLAEAGLVDFDSDRKLVDVRGDADDLPLAVDRPSSGERPRESQ